MLIAMDVEDMLTALGAATVLAAASVSEARDLIDDPAIDFAILDLNLDGETSLPIAEILAGRGIPFVFASGYGDQAGVTGAFPGVSVITKPYGHDEIVAAWRDIAR
ncbi:MAG: two-component system sensor histidine kinase/response regulator [Rhizorhabdus sp.]|nr:two-component system sensor histidine kinase/response regulator [Rhizorhabdus sp.]